MSRLRALLLSPFFYPETISTGKYNTVLVQALATAGVDITVVASHPFYPAWKTTYSEAAPRDISVIRGGLSVRYPSMMLLRRIVLELSYAMHVWWTIRRRHLRPDLMIAVFPPVLFFCWARFLPRGCRKVGIVHDFQGVLGFRTKGMVSRAIQFLVKKAELRAFQRCDRLILLSESMARLAREEYAIDEQKVRVAYPFVSVQAEKSVGKNLVEVFPSDYQHVVYSGALGQKQNPTGLYQFFREGASRIPHARFHIFSEGPIFEKICRIHESDPVAGLELHRLVAESDLEELYARSTVQVIPQAEGVSEACLPSKLPNILASGCAAFVICERESELGEIVQKYNGMWVSEWDPEVLVTCLMNFVQALKGESREARKATALPLVRCEFSIEKLLNAVLGSSIVVNTPSTTA